MLLPPLKSVLASMFNVVFRAVDAVPQAVIDIAVRSYVPP
jgi:hypothetical protein